MASSNTIDLSKLPAPEVIEAVDFVQEWEAMKARLIAAHSGFADILRAEGQSLTMLAQAVADKNAKRSQEFNERARGLMLAFASGGTLEQLAAIFGVERLEVQQADPDADPPIPQVMETDEALRARTQQALEGFSTAGPRGAYEYHARSASGKVIDVFVESPSPREVVVTVLSTEGDGTPSAETLELVASAVNDEKIRPLTDHVTVNACSVVNLTIEAELELFDGPDLTAVTAAANEGLSRYVEESRALGRDIEISAIHAALHVSGVSAVRLISPAVSVAVTDTQVAHVTSTQITVAQGA